MTLDDILDQLFADERRGLHRRGNLLQGKAATADGSSFHVLGLVGGAALGVDDALILAEHVLGVVASDDADPLLFLVDASSQRMRRRDELMGLHEYLAHLAKTLRLAAQAGHPTVGLLYGGAAAGAFIATALACSTTVALPGAEPMVMDLPSMARVTKLPLEVLHRRAQATPVFAPGLANLTKTGAIAAIWDPTQPLAPQLVATVTEAASADDRRRLGHARGGRPKAMDIAEAVRRAAVAHG